MTPAQSHSVQYHLPHLRAVFDRLVEIENNPDIDWIELLEAREKADPLADDSWMRGYVVGVADAVGMSIADILKSLGTSRSCPIETTSSSTRCRRRIVKARNLRRSQ